MTSKEQHEFVDEIRFSLKEAGNSKIALKQKAYLKNQFEFFGIMTKDRRALMKPFLQKEFLPEKKSLASLVSILLNQSEREFHYFANELVAKYKKQLEKDDLSLLETLVTENSWWDTVDFVAVNLWGAYFQTFPEEIASNVERYLASDHLWLQRSALLFQLKYKEDTDHKLMRKIIMQLLGSREFFINKAIGWSLREQSRLFPDWVKEQVESLDLAPLSKREALRLM